MDRLQRAHGFCLRHTRHLLERRAPDRISYVAGYVLRYCADWLRSLQATVTPERHGSRANGQQTSGPFRPAVDCPACEQEQEGSRLYAKVIVGCLKDADIVRAFRASDGLCLPHFLAAAHVAGWETLQILAEEQIRHLEEARTHLSAIQARGTDGALSDALRAALGRLYGPDLDKSIRPFLVAGRRPGGPPTTDTEDHATVRERSSAGWSPAFDETCRLLSQPGCSLCRVAASIREQYLAWLGEEIRDNAAIGYRWGQVQCLCTEHAWQFARRCAPPVLHVTCERLLAGIAERLRELLWEIRAPIPPTVMGRVRVLPARWRTLARPEDPIGRRPPLSQRIRRTLATVWQGPREALDRALSRALYWNVCPVCQCVKTAERRAAERLLAVLEDPEGRRTFERSYALCLRHAPLVLQPMADPGLRRYIAAVLLARVEVDCWETEEYLRKCAWGQRYEPKGAEGEAWLRASTRIAGIAMEQQYGF